VLSPAGIATPISAKLGTGMSDGLSRTSRRRIGLQKSGKIGGTIATRQERK
jgi:hypothetical protein